MNQAFSHYQLIEELGRGGGGVVYLAEDTLLLRRVAIKFPKPSASHHRMLAEARAASALTHRSIAAIYDCGEEKGNPYIVMELVDGGSLYELMRGGPLPVERAVEIASEVAGALDEAHSRRIIHRDIKPANIRLDRRGSVKVVDFGLAKTLAGHAVGALVGGDTQTLEGIVEGTPRYMSPEQARGIAIDERSDLFSLGVVLYECLSGKPAFEGSSNVEILGQVLHVEPPPPSEYNPAVPVALDSLVRKAMAKDREARYQSAGELLRDLEVFRGSGQGPAMPDSGRRSRFRSKRVWAAAVLVMAAAATAGWFTRQRSGTPPRPEVLRWYEAGTAAIRENSYFRASKALERAVSLDPVFAPAQARLAEAYNELDDSNRAQRAMLQALGADMDKLSPPERQMIQAIRLTLTGNFSGAVGIYSDLLSAVPEAEKAAAYVDLGRAHEQALNLSEAMICYREAVNRAPEYPAAFLRLGILHGRKQDRAAATEAFDRAESLFNILGNVEGVTEVIYQRALQAEVSSRVPEAVELLERARQKADAAGNIHQSIGVLLHTSLVDLRKGDTAAAESHTQQALELARRNRLERLTSRGLVSLGSAFHVRGDAKLAESYYTQGLDAARVAGLRRTEARALMSLGSLHEQQGDVEQAEREIRDALPFYERGGFEKERAQARQLLGRISRERGELDEARKVFQAELQLARDKGDRSQMAAAYEDLGETEAAAERYSVALAHFLELVRITREQGDRMMTAYGLWETGGVLWRLGRFAEAKVNLQESRGIAEGKGGPVGLAADIDLEEAKMAVSALKFGEALAILRRLRADAAKLSTGNRIEIARIRCEADVGSGLAREGEKSCRESLDLARKARLPALIRSALLSHAVALQACGDSRNALAAARQVIEECGTAGRLECQAQASVTAARAARAGGDGAQWDEYSRKAMLQLASFEQSLEPGDRGTFHERPDVIQWRKQLAHD